MYVKLKYGTSKNVEPDIYLFYVCKNIFLYKNVVLDVYLFYVKAKNSVIKLSVFKIILHILFSLSKYHIKLRQVQFLRFEIL